MGWLRFPFFVICLLTTVAFPAHAEKRVALVVGNSEYRNAPELINPKNDAQDIAAALERLGFEVILGLNLDQAGMNTHARKFATALGGAELGLFFYAGHGLQVGGSNYLVPVDAALGSESDLDFGTMRLELVLRQMEREVPTSIVFLDACRDNPLARSLARSMGTRSASIGRGLAQVEAGVGTLIAFATQPGNVALDGDGRNSPFTGALLRYIESPGLDLGGVMIEVRNTVLAHTGGTQVPWEHSSLTGRVYFSEAAAADGGEATEGTRKAVEIAFWNSIQTSSNARLFESYLSRYPDGEFATIARLKVDELKVEPEIVAPPGVDDGRPVELSDDIAEIQSRLFELNYDPGAADGRAGELTRSAIHEFQAQAGLVADGVATHGLLKRLRGLGGLHPWGALVFSVSRQDWGMAWGAATRKEAIAKAQASCGSSRQCESELTFFGTECGAFAHSDRGWAMTARPLLADARKAALDECRANGGDCRLVATVCADGAERQVAAQ